MLTEHCALSVESVESVELQCRPKAHERVAAALCTHKPNRA